MQEMEARRALAELLAFALRQEETEDEVTRRLLARYGTLDRVLEHSEESLRETDGLGTGGALLLSSIPALARRVSREEQGVRPVFDRFSALEGYMESLYLGKRQEELYLLALNRRRELLSARRILQGTLCEVCMSARLVVEAVLATRAEMVVLCHNHPGGSIRFSMADVTTMRHFLPLMGRLSIPVVDHALYAGGAVNSMRASNWIAENLWMDTGVDNVSRADWLR